MDEFLVAFYHKAQREILEQAAQVCKRNEFTVIAESQIRQLSKE